MQLTKEDHKYRKDIFEVCPINEDPHFYYANFFFQCAPEYNKLIELHKEDFLGRIVGALQAYDFKALANAKDKASVNVTLESMKFTQSLFKPQDLNAENVDAVMRLCAIGFYIWFRVAVENPTDLDIMMFFQAKDEDVHTNMTYSLDANTDWGKKQGYSYLDIETYFALYNTDIPQKCSIEELQDLCRAFQYVCGFIEENQKNAYMSQFTTSKEFIREHRKWCLYLLFLARLSWKFRHKEEAKVLKYNVTNPGNLPDFAKMKYKVLWDAKGAKDDWDEYFLPDRDMLYERFFISCMIFTAIAEMLKRKAKD